MTYWVCDYRFSDVRKYTPTRHVKPTEVTCLVVPQIYQPNLKEIKTKSGKKIPMWDNTRFPEFICIFDNKEECVRHYNSLVEENCERLKKHIEYLNLEYDKMRKHLIA